MSPNADHQRAVAEDARTRRRRIASAQAWTTLDSEARARIRERRVNDTCERLSRLTETLRWEWAFHACLVLGLDYCLL